MKAKFDDINEQLHREAMTMTDDELLALARDATPGEHVAMDMRTLNAPASCINFAVVDGNKETARVWTEHDARYYAAANPSAIITMIERHRAERAEWDAHAGQWKVTLDEQRGEVGRLTAERDRLHEDRRALDIEIMRLTCERDADGASLYLKEKTIAHADARIKALEAALATAQKRIAELKEALEHAISIIEKHVPRDALGTNSQGAGDGWNDQSWPILDEYLHYMRAALAGGTAGDGERVTQHQRPVGRSTEE